MAADLSNFAKEIVAKIDIVDVIGNVISLKKAGREYHACCPFHNEKTPSFTVSQQKQFFYCFGCHAKGDVISFVMQYQRLSFPAALEKLAQTLGLTLPSTHQQQPSVDPECYKLMRNLTLAAKQDLKPDSAELEYLLRRGLSLATIKHYHLGYTGECHQLFMQNSMRSQFKLLETCGLLSPTGTGTGHRPKFFKRILFPIQDSTGRVIAFGGRVTDGRKPKYLNSPETKLFKKRYSLYGLYQAKQSHSQRIFVVEGYLDVLALAQNGIDHAVACLGTAFSAEHWQLLRRFATEVVFCFDGDRAGRHAAWQTLIRILPALQAEQNARFMFMPDGEDPDSYVQKHQFSGFQALAKQAITWDKYFLESLHNQHDVAQLSGRASYVKAAKQYAQTLTDPVLQQLLLEQIMQKNVAQPTARPAVNNTGIDQLKYDLLAHLTLKCQQPWCLPESISWQPGRGALDNTLAAWLHALRDKPSTLGADLINLSKDSELFPLITAHANKQQTLIFDPLYVQAGMIDLLTAELDIYIKQLFKEVNEGEEPADNKVLLQRMIAKKKQLQQLRYALFNQPREALS